MVAVGDGQSSRGSSPMSSPPQGLSDTISVAKPAQPQFLRPGDVAFPQLSRAPQPPSASSTSANTTNGYAKAASHDDNKKVKQTRKRRDPEVVAAEKAEKAKKAAERAEKAAEKAAAAEAAREKKPRKPREPKDPNVPAAGSRKKQKTDSSATSTPTANRQPTLGDLVGKFQTPLPPTPSAQQTPPVQIMKSEEIKPVVAAPPPAPARPASSGQRYDPIRASMTVDPYSTPAHTSTASLQVSPPAHRASASPAIASLMNPAAPSDTLMSPPVLASAPAQVKSPAVSAAMPPPPSVNRQPEVQLASTTPVNNAPQTISHPAPLVMDDAMDVDTHDEQTPAQPIAKLADKEKEKESQKPAVKSTAAPAPKAKRASPPAPTGSGLLSGSDLFGGPSAVTEDHKRHGVNIDIDIPLNPAGNNTINIAQEILKKYGKNAINPRAAAHRERLLQVAAAANRLEPGTGDDISVDLNSEAENDSNVEMGGMEEEKKGEDEPKKRRRRKVEDYDKEDDFIDDTELAWEEGAAV
ncbi:HPC2-domain-containing protein, partial [Aureobasidium sp. EXF-8845]